MMKTPDKGNEPYIQEHDEDEYSCVDEEENNDSALNAMLAKEGRRQKKNKPAQIRY